MAQVILVVLMAVLVALVGVLAGMGAAAMAMNGGTLRRAPEEPMLTRNIRTEEEEAIYLAELDEVMAGLAATAEREGIPVDPREIRRHAREILDTAYDHRGG